MRCLAKHSSDRPADAGHVLRELDLCVLSETWTAADAATWWQQKQKSENDVTSMDPVGILTTPAPDSTAAYHDPPRGNL
jgi:hypothetical protein